MGFIGTLRNNRLRDCCLKTENDLKEERHGAFHYAADAVKNLVVVRWYNRSVTPVSNYATIEPVYTLMRQKLRLQSEQALDLSLHVPMLDFHYAGELQFYKSCPNRAKIC